MTTMGQALNTQKVLVGIASRDVSVERRKTLPLHAYRRAEGSSPIIQKPCHSDGRHHPDPSILVDIPKNGLASSRRSGYGVGSIRRIEPSGAVSGTTIPSLRNGETYADTRAHRTTTRRPSTQWSRAGAIKTAESAAPAPCVNSRVPD